MYSHIEYEALRTHAKPLQIFNSFGMCSMKLPLCLLSFWCVLMKPEWGRGSVFFSKANSWSLWLFQHFQVHKIEIFRFAWIFFYTFFFRLMFLYTFKHKLIWIILLYPMNKYWCSLISYHSEQTQKRRKICLLLASIHFFLLAHRSFMFQVSVAYGASDELCASSRLSDFSRQTRLA